MSVSRLAQTGKNVASASSDTTTINIGDTTTAMIVGIVNDLSATIVSVVYADESLTLAKLITSTTYPTYEVALYYLASPIATFSNDLVTTFSGVCNARIYAVRFSGTDATVPVANILSGEVTGATPPLGVITNVSGDISWVFSLNQPTITFDEVVNFNGSPGTVLGGAILATTGLVQSTFDTADVSPTAAFDLGDVGTVWTYIAYSVTALAAAPTCTSSSPALGPTAGGTPVTITGTGFDGGASVAIGGVACTSVVVVGATSITCVTGAHAAGLVNVVVTNSDLQTGTKTNGYTYVAPAAGGGAVNPLLLRERYVLINRAPGAGIWKP